MGAGRSHGRSHRRARTKPGMLQLDSQRARELLAGAALGADSIAVQRTMAGTGGRTGADARALCLADIAAYEAARDEPFQRRCERYPAGRREVVKRQRLGDERGVFRRLFCGEELRRGRMAAPMAQINHS